MWRVDEAVNLLEPILKEQPNHSLALARLAWCRWQEDKIDEAIELYNQSSKLNPNRIPVWSGLTRLYLEEKQPSLTQEILNKGLKYLAHS